MKTLAFAAIAAAGLTVIPAIHADEVDKKTTIKVNETILIPGRTLAPGTYVIKLDRSPSSRNIVRIFNEDQSQLQATILAINNYRLDPSDKTVLRYWETPSGSPPALRAWFAPGDNYGQEFAYPKKLADELARTNNNAKVPYYADDAQVGGNSLENVAVVSEETDTPAPARREISEASPALAPVPQSEGVAERQDPAPAAQTAPAGTLLAQNNPPPQPANGPEAPAAQLPQTATSLGSVLAIGLILLASAAVFRYSRRV
jgi:LPXTG-motif cell wall-anchored protein